MMRKTRVFSALFFALVLSVLPVFADEQTSTGTKPISFASYAYFVDKMQFPVKKIGQLWSTPLSIYEGPFHTNDQIHIYLPPHYFEEGHSPFFKGPVTTAAASIVYYEDYGPVGPGGQVNPKLFNMIFGSEVKTGVDKILLPTHPDESVKRAAFGGYVPEKPLKERGIYLPHDANNRLTGGIIVNSSLTNLAFVAEHNQNFKMVLGHGRKETTLEIDTDRDKTSVSSEGEKTVQYEGVPNGAIYVAGDIGDASGRIGVSGKIRGKWSLATPGDVFIPNSILYSDTSAGSQPSGKDCFAIIAKDVFITRNAPDLLFLYATIFAARQEGKEKIGTLFVLPNTDMPHDGVLIWWGNYIGEYPAIMGKFDRSTGASRDGYRLQKFYDARLATEPPPFFPVVEDRKQAAATTP